MRNPLPKCLALTVLLLMAAFVGHAASVDSSHTFLAAGLCSCCPATCGGGTYYGCYNTVDMPPNAVTCVYKDAAGKLFECVSCLNASADTTTAALNAIFAPGPASATVAQ